MKQIYQYILVFVTIFFITGISALASDSGDGQMFQGERTVTYVVDQSMLSNYFNGGRAALDVYIRAAKPEWLKVTYRVEEKSLFITLTFTFDTRKDYEEKLVQLSGREVTIVYSDKISVAYEDNILSVELLNFLKTIMNEEDVLDVYSSYDLFQYHSGMFRLNGIEYEALNRLSIADERIDIMASSISITTIIDGTFHYKRTVQMEVPTENLSDDENERLIKQIESTGEKAETSIDGGMTLFSVTFNAADGHEAAFKTMMALRVSDFIAEDKYYADEDNMEIKFHEHIDLSRILEGQYRYSMEFPDICHDFFLENSDEGEHEGRIITHDIANVPVDFSYIRPFSFSKIQIDTDISDIFGRIQRSICYCVPLEIAGNYHENVKSKLSKTLVDGQTLNIYDDAPYRKYEVSYTTWFTKQLVKMTQSQFRITDKAVMHRPYSPFWTGRIRESIGKFTNAYTKSTGKVEYRIIYPKGVIIKEARSGSDGQGIYSEQLTLDNSRISIRYADYSLRIWIITGVSFLLAAGIVFSLGYKIKKGIRRLLGKSKFCPQCGRENLSEAVFCGKCGHKL